MFGDDGISVDAAGHAVAASYLDGQVYVWNAVSGQRLAILRFNARNGNHLPDLPVLSPSGQTAEVFGNGSGGPTLWDIATRSNIAVPRLRGQRRWQASRRGCHLRG